MPPRHTSNSSATEVEVSVQEIVFSCGICQATASEIYANKDEIHGLSSSGDESGIVTKLWIAECSHIFCGKHLEGGGVPFHATNELPRAQCPVCVSEQKRGYEERKGLYAIRGLGQSEYDQVVPEGYMQVPPFKLDSGSRDLDATRFQYTHLTHYAKQVTKHWKTAERKRRAMESTLSKERKQWRKHEVELNERIAALEKTEAKLKKWEARKAMINHYLGLVSKMSEDIDIMRGQLLELGFEVPEAQYALDIGKTVEPQPQQSFEQSKKKNSSTTPAASSSSRKRKHNYSHGDYADEDLANNNENHSYSQRWDSRELMPPPLHSMRQPPARQYPSQASQHKSVQAQSQQPIEIYEDSRWHDAHSDVVMRDICDLSRARAPHDKTSHNHGALPFRPTQPETLPSHRDLHQPEQVHGQGLTSYDLLSGSTQVVQRQGLLSMPPRRRSQQFLDTQANQIDHIHPAVISEDHSAQASDFNGANYIPVQHPGERSFYAPVGSVSRPTAGPSDILSKPSWRKPLEPISSTAASPFFGRRAALQRPDITQQPPARGLMMPPRPNPPTRQGTMGRQYDSVARAPPLDSFHDTRNPPQSPFGPQSYFQPTASQGQHHYAAPSYRDQPFSSQAPPMSDAVFQRLTLPRQQAMGPPTSDLQRGRLTLLPSRSRQPMLGSQDSQLSMIPGARGSAPLQNMYGRQSLASAHNSSRFLSSVAGARRHVQR